MLRSLVGSEMCIRDRASTSHRANIMSGKYKDIGVAVVEGVLLGKRTTLCLLYTSDAADDLLCVDIGGRRIIKKKTTHSPNNMPVTCTEQ